MLRRATFAWRLPSTSNNQLFITTMAAPSSRFLTEKKLRRISNEDRSRKGEIDEPIRQLINNINDNENYFTTSSCSGRIIVFSVTKTEDGSTVRKKGCNWLFVSHEPVTLENLVETLAAHKGSAVFKFEPFILHVRCRTLSSAQALLSASVASGFRNSGITIGNSGKITVAIRSTHVMEVPLSNSGVCLISEEYLKYLVEVANAKFEENSKRIERFSAGFRALGSSGTSARDNREKSRGQSRKLCHANFNSTEGNNAVSLVENHSEDIFSDIKETFL